MDDPTIVTRSFTARTRIEILPITWRTSPEGEDESSKQRDDEHHASNQSMTILDERKNLHSNLYSTKELKVYGLC